MKAPILFLTYNRFATAKKVFESIRKYKPTKLYFASNSNKPRDLIDLSKVNQVRSLLNKIDWPCVVYTRFLDIHLNVKESLNTSISWFFDNEEFGIILEDDCLPHPNFYTFCSSLLLKYKDDQRIFAIAGHNFQDGIWRGDGSYYFSRYNHVWGWASWRRAWLTNDVSMKFWPSWKRSAEWQKYWESRISRFYWTFILDRMYKGKINTWDYCWTANVWYRNGLTIIPNVNLVSNIGFGPEATHTRSIKNPSANMEVFNLVKIKHPKIVKRDVSADIYTFHNHYGGVNFTFPKNLFLLPFKALKYLLRNFFS